MIPCATCGEPPTGTYNDGSPRYSTATCLHDPIWPGESAHPGYEAAAAAIANEPEIVVELDEAEMLEAAKCGQDRYDKAVRRNLKDHFGTPSPVSHLLGAQGERAFSKWVDDPWKCTMNGFGGAADVVGCQVRAVPRRSEPMKVRDSDPDRIPVVSIVAHPPRFLIRGWLFAREAKARPEWYADPGNRGAPAWFAPAHALRPMSTFYESDGVRMAMHLPPKGA